jgi:hypothetical protein
MKGRTFCHPRVAVFLKAADVQYDKSIGVSIAFSLYLLPIADVDSPH